MATFRPIPAEPAPFRWDRPFEARYRYMRVSRRTRDELSPIHGITGGAITRNSDSPIRESARLDVMGSLDLGADLVRIYLDAVPVGGGATVTECLGTFVVERSSRSTDGSMSTTSPNLYGLLKIAASSGPRGTYTVPRGTNVVDRCRDILTDRCNLDCSAVSSGKALAQARSYGPGVQTDEGEGKETWLDIVNDLLGIAGYSAARTDPRGVAVLEPYVEPADRPVAWEFREGPNSGFLPQVSDGYETVDVHNVVVVVSSTSDKVAVGSASDDDPAHEWSTASLGYEVVRVESVSDELTASECAARARRLLAEEMDVPRVYTWTHPYVPVGLADRVALEWSVPPVSADPVIRTQDIDLGPACLVGEEAKSHG